MSKLQSLRWRLILSIFLGMSAVFGVGGWIAYRAIAAELYAGFDRSLSARGQSVISMIETEMGFVDFEWAESGATHPPGHVDGEEVFQIWAAGDKILARSPLLGEGSLPRPAVGEKDSLLEGVDVPGEAFPWRGMAIRFVAAVDPDALPEDLGEDERAEIAELEKRFLRLDEPATMELAIAKIDTVRPALSDMRQLFFWLWLAASLVSAGIIWLLVRQNMRPLDALKVQIGKLGSSEPNETVVLENPPTELTPVVEELNRLLARVGDSLRRERNLTSNVAHELRTPIAGLLSTLEVTLSRERSSADYREASEDCLDIAKRMHWLVNNLLSIARVEAGNVELHDHIVELKTAFQDWWVPFAEAAAAKNLQVAWEISAHARLETDPEFLRVVVSNLFDNAVSYTSPGGTIVIRANDSGITIGNDVVDLTPDAARRVFEPFWRNAESREEAGVHAGLGLSLCQKIVRILGGEIAVALPDPGNHFEVNLQFAR